MRIAAVQLNSGDDVSQNLELTQDLVTKARAGGALLAVLPECFALMAKDHSERLRVAEPEEGAGPIQTFLANLARNQQIWILASGVFVRCSESQKIRNSTFLFDSNGANLCRYDKIHLFNVNLPDGEIYSESCYTEAGTELVVADTPVGKCGVTVCYDVRFPSLYQSLVEQGATWFAVPSAFSQTTGKDHWEVLLRARAVENHCYVVAPAQWGVHPSGRQTYGHSMIVDPWGTVVACEATGNGVVFGELDGRLVDTIRSRFNS